MSRVVFTTPEANEVMAQPVQILLGHAGKLPLGPGQPGISSLGAPARLCSCSWPTRRNVVFFACGIAMDEALHKTTLKAREGATELRARKRCAS